MKITTAIALVIGILFLSTAFADGGGGGNSGVNGDLTPDQPLVDQQLVKEIQNKIAELSAQSEANVQASGMSVPDFKPSYDDLQQSLTTALTGYLTALSQMSTAVDTELAHIKALEQQAQTDNTGMFSQLLDDEYKQAFPQLNKQLNQTYTAAVSNLYRLPEQIQSVDRWNGPVMTTVTRDIPIEWKDVGSGNYSLMVQSGDEEFQSDGYGNNMYNARSFDSHFFGGGLTDQGVQDSTSFLHQNFAYSNLFMKCQTGACVLKLKESLDEAMRLADQLNEGITFTNAPSKTVVQKANVAMDSPIALAMLRAVQGLLAAPKPDQSTLIAAEIGKLLIAPPAAGVALAALPVMALERTIDETRAIVGATYAQYQLQVSPLNSYPVDQIESSLDTAASYYAGTLPPVVFSN